MVAVLMADLHVYQSLVIQTSQGSCSVCSHVTNMTKPSESQYTRQQKEPTTFSGQGEGNPPLAWSTRPILEMVQKQKFPGAHS